MNNNNKKGILDYEGKKLNPLTNKEYSEEYKNLGKIWSNFPVYKDAKKIIKLINDNQVLLLISGTGSGKSVLVPKFALHTTDYKGKVVMTIPKRGAAKGAAEFAAKTLDVELGQEVGYQYRGAQLPDGRKPKSENTKLLISTDGSVVAQLINDPKLTAYDIVIIDEAHERGIQIDLLLLLMKKALKLNQKLKLIIMSATINPEIFANYFKKDYKYAEIEVSGKTNYPVDIHYLPNKLNNPETDFIEAGIKQIIKILEGNEEGDVIFFVNSENEAVDACQRLQVEVKSKKLDKPFCIEYSGSTVRNKNKNELAKNQHKYKNLPNGPYSRKILIATNAAEASLTVEGLVFVIDSGWAYVDSYNPDRMERRLLQERISKAQAKQRAGRAGRTKPGVCYRLYTEKEFNEFLDYPVVDIRKSDLTDDFLRFMKLPYVNNVNELLKLLKELIEPPGDNFVKAALYRLFALGAIDKMGNDGQLTELGEQMVKFRKLDPVMAKTVIESYFYRVEYDVISIAALLNKADGRMNSFIKDLRVRRDNKDYSKEKQKYDKTLKKFTSAYGDILTLLKIYKEFKDYSEKHDQDQTRKWCNENYLKYESLKSIKKNAQDIMREVQEIVFPKEKFINKLEETEHIYDYDKEGENITSKTKSGGYKLKLKKGGANESEILSSLIHGLFLNMAKITSPGKYTNCFPFEKTEANLARDTRLETSRSGPKYIIYMELANILGRQKYNLVTKVPESLLTKLNDKQKNMIITCFQKTRTNNRNKRNTRKSYNKSHKKSYKKGKKQSYGKFRRQHGKKSRKFYK